MAQLVKKQTANKLYPCLISKVDKAIILLALRNLRLQQNPNSVTGAKIIEQCNNAERNINN